VYNGPEQAKEWIIDIAQKFRKKGALSPDKALRPQELGLPPEFQEAMKKQLGQTGIFVETNGNYYLSEERLKEILEGGFAPQVPNARGIMVSLRVIRIATTVLFVVLLIINILIQNWELRLVSILVAVIWLIVTIMLIYYLSRIRNRIFLNRES
jgi:hypothetical protein